MPRMSRILSTAATALILCLTARAAGGGDPACNEDAGNCFVPNGTPGCDDIVCCNAVCSFDPFCCKVVWDAQCANETGQAGGACVKPQPACGVFFTGDCYEANGTGYCADLCDGQPCAGCCDGVCASDPFCCSVEWDSVCVSEALQSCGCAPEDVPANDDCADALPIGLGDTLLSNLCASPDGPDHDSCDDEYLVGLGNDVWFVFDADYTGDLTVSTCGLVSDGWEVQMAAYAGADCDQLDDPPLACYAPVCGEGMAGTLMTFPVEAGQSYLIRVGNTFLGPAGQGVLRLVDEPAEQCQLGAPPGAVVEDEPCGADANGGCNFAPEGVTCCVDQSGDNGIGCNDTECETAVCALDPFCCRTVWDGLCADLAHDVCDLCVAFEEVQPGDVIRGTAWGDGQFRDTDWYRLELEETTEVTLTISATFPHVAAFMHQDPPGAGTCAAMDGNFSSSVSGVPDCQPRTVSEVLEPGTHILFVSTDMVFNDMPCMEGGPCPADADGNGQVDVADLVTVILDWSCADPPGPCAGDVTGDGVTDVQDVVAVITGWGPCPGGEGLIGNDYVLIIGGS